MPGGEGGECFPCMGALRVGVGAEARACSARSKEGCCAAGAGSSAGWPDGTDGVGSSMPRNAVVAFMARSAAGAAARACACRHTHCAQSSSPTRSLIAQKKLGMAQAEIDVVKYMAKSRRKNAVVRAQRPYASTELGRPPPRRGDLIFPAPAKNATSRTHSHTAAQPAPSHAAVAAHLLLLPRRVLWHVQPLAQQPAGPRARC